MLTLEQIACVAKRDTILARYRRLIASKFDGSKFCEYPDRPSASREVAELVVGIARENSDWGYNVLRARLETSVITYPIRPLATSFDGSGVLPAHRQRQDCCFLNT